MEDKEIIALYLSRDHQAISETQLKYGRKLMDIAGNILSSKDDCVEVLNDTLLRVWDSIPPNHPSSLWAYLAKITRRLAIDKLRYRSRRKRGSSQYIMSLHELEECATEGDTTVNGANLTFLANAIGDYLRTLPKEARVTFIGRYFYADSISEIAAYCSMSPSKVKSMLRRTRIGLREYLKKEGFEL